MKKLVSAALAGAMLFATIHPSLAGQGEGVVAGVDTATRTIMLEDGTTWTAAEDVDLTALAAGDTIQVTFEDGTTIVTAIEKASM